MDSLGLLFLAKEPYYFSKRELSQSASFASPPKCLPLSAMESLGLLLLAKEPYYVQQKSHIAASFVCFLSSVFLRRRWSLWGRYFWQKSPTIFSKRALSQSASFASPPKCLPSSAMESLGLLLLAKEPYHVQQKSHIAVSFVCFLPSVFLHRRWSLWGRYFWQKSPSIFSKRALSQSALFSLKCLPSSAMASLGSIFTRIFTHTRIHTRIHT